MTKPGKEAATNENPQEGSAPKQVNGGLGDWAKEVENEEKKEETLAQDLSKLSTSDITNATQNDSQQQQQQQQQPQQKAVLSGLLDDILHHEVEVRLADVQANVASPLYSARSFEELGLKPELLKGIYAMRFNKPSKIQEKALPLLLSDPPRNLIAQSQSGTGKTAAFVLTMLSRVDANFDVPQAICLSPTRELARQIGEVVTKMGQFTSIRMCYALKDVAAKSLILDHIIIGTPGTVYDLIKMRFLRMDKIKVFVLDEADVMMDKQGMGDQSLRIKRFLPTSCQIVLFSATFRPDVREFASRMVPNANTITLKREELSVEGIKQFYMDCKSYEHKYEILSHIYGLLTIGQSIIFCHTRSTSDELYRRMTTEGHTVSLLHGGLLPEQRDAVIDEFRKGNTKVLIATNVLARGIDILQVSLVINFDLPLDSTNQPDFETYLHRIGRTGRFGRTGVSINFIHDKRSYEQMLQIQNFFGREIHRIPTEDIEVIERKLQEINHS